MNPAEEPDPTQKYSVQEERAKFGEEKPKAKETARLIWASKPRKEPNPKDLEFQTAEEVYPNVADARDHQLSTYTTNGRKIAERPNRLIWGDNLLVMQALLAQGYEGQIDLIYIDPPFNTGENFNFCDEVKIGELLYEKELPMSERLAYTDTWSRGKDSFLDMLYPRIQLMQRLLSETGSIYVHCDWRVNSLIRLIMDEIFGPNAFTNEIVWRRRGGALNNFKSLGGITDTILFYQKSEKAFFKPLKTKESDEAKQYIAERFIYNDGDGRLYSRDPVTNPSATPSPSLTYEYKGYQPPAKGWAFSIETMQRWDNEGRLYFPPDKTQRIRRKTFLDEYEGQPIQNLWTDIFVINSQAKESVSYPTQKPETLLSRIIEMSSEKNSIVADFFCGSGTTGAAAEKLGRRWVLSDISKTAVQVTRSRLVNQNSNPFVIENLGNYQRQLIYAKEVNLKQMYAIILKLYGAVPHPDMQGFGTSREDKSTLVYVCEPDRAMTAKKALDLSRMARAADGKGYRNLVILAWDYDYDFDDAYKKVSKGRDKELSDVEFKIIPSDVYKYLRSTKLGDPELAKKITFYQKPYIRIGEPEIASRNGKTASVKIKIEQYVVMDLPLKDESKRPEIEKCLAKNFAYLIDYWTMDWDYNGDIFRSEWQAIRDRRGNQPVPVVAEKTLERGKRYMIAVRVVDVFGNDSSGTKEIDLR